MVWHTREITPTSYGSQTMSSSQDVSTQIAATLEAIPPTLHWR